MLFQSYLQCKTSLRQWQWANVFSVDSSAWAAWRIVKLLLRELTLSAVYHHNQYKLEQHQVKILIDSRTSKTLWVPCAMFHHFQFLFTALKDDQTLASFVRQTWRSNSWVKMYLVCFEWWSNLATVNCYLSNAGRIQNEDCFVCSFTTQQRLNFYIFFYFYTLLSQWGFFPWAIHVTFPEDSQQQWVTGWLNW